MSSLLPYTPTLATVRRRTGGATGTGATLDALNAQVYGAPSTWTAVYTDMPCRLEIKSKPIIFTPAGERVDPSSNILYISSEYSLQAEDRIFIGSDVYIAQGVQTAFDPIGNVHHYEIQVLIEP